jgi:hypothetical protein
MLIVAALAEQEGKIDKRHGDPDAGGKNSGQKAVRLLNPTPQLCVSLSNAACYAHLLGIGSRTPYSLASLGVWLCFCAEG